MFLLSSVDGIQNPFISMFPWMNVSKMLMASKSAIFYQKSLHGPYTCNTHFETFIPIRTLLKSYYAFFGTKMYPKPNILELFELKSINSRINSCSVLNEILSYVCFGFERVLLVYCLKEELLAICFRRVIFAAWSGNWKHLIANRSRLMWHEIFNQYEFMVVPFFTRIFFIFKINTATIFSSRNMIANKRKYKKTNIPLNERKVARKNSEHRYTHFHCIRKLVLFETHVSFNGCEYEHWTRL